MNSGLLCCRGEGGREGVLEEGGGGPMWGGGISVRCNLHVSTGELRDSVISFAVNKLS